MEEDLTRKAICLIREIRVMTLAVSDTDIPWSSPVYFVFHDHRFYFFSNETSRHIRFAQDKKNVSASIFHDSDQLDRIFGFQMSGRIEKVSKLTTYFAVVKKYVSKFDFLKKAFGTQIMENKDFFKEKFKSQLYCFVPGHIYLSDNSKPSEKRMKIDLNRIA